MNRGWIKQKLFSIFVWIMFQVLRTQITSWYRYSQDILTLFADGRVISYRIGGSENATVYLAWQSENKKITRTFTLLQLRKGPNKKWAFFTV